LADSVELDFRGLQIAVVYEDPPDLIEVRVRASNGQFGGDVRAYAPPDAVRRLADTIRGFPETAADQREFALGDFGPDLAGGAVSFNFTCTDHAGHAVVALRMESGEPSREPQTARFFFEFEPASLDRFVGELRVLGPRSGHARLPAA
jgi:hypothetical protein